MLFLVVGIAALWLCFRISFFYPLIGDSPSAGIVRRECFASFLLGAIAATGVWSLLPTRFSLMVSQKTLSALPECVTFVSFALLICLGTTTCSQFALSALALLTGASAGTSFLQWLFCLSEMPTQQSGTIVAFAFLLHMLASSLLSFLDNGALRLAVALASAIALICWIAMQRTPQKNQPVEKAAIGISTTVPARVLVLTGVFAYAGAILWGINPPQEMGVVTLGQHLFTFGIAGITFGIVLTKTRRTSNSRSLTEALRTVLICLFFSALFIALFIGPQESHLSTSTLMAARFCLEAYALIVLLGSLRADNRNGFRFLALGFATLVIAPSLLGNVMLPMLFSSIGLESIIDINTSITVATFVLVVATVVFLDPSKMPSRVEQMDTKERHSYLATQYKLTPRELEVLELLARGNSQKKIADLLHIAPTTVQTHTSSVYRKVGVRTKQELIDKIGQIVSDDTLQNT